MATSGRGSAYKLSRRLISRGSGRLPTDMITPIYFGGLGVRLQWLLLNVAFIASVT